MEQSLILFKPDAVQRQIIGNILHKYESKGLKIVAMKMLHVSQELAKKHYAEHLDKPFFPSLLEYITSSPLIAMVVEGYEAVRTARILNGATDPLQAENGSIRGDYATRKTYNLVHSSDSKESALREIEIFFNKDEIFSYKISAEKWL